MKKIMMTVSLILITQLSYAPGPEIDAPHKETISHSDTTPEAKANAEHNQREAQEYQQSQATNSNKPQPSTDAEPIPNAPEPAQPPSTPINLDVQATQIATQTVVKPGLFTGKSINTTVMAHPDGTHSVTETTVNNGFLGFGKSKSSTTEIYNNLKSEYPDINNKSANEIKSYLKDNKTNLKDNLQFQVKRKYESLDKDSQSSGTIKDLQSKTNYTADFNSKGQVIRAKNQTTGNFHDQPSSILNQKSIATSPAPVKNV